MPENYDIDQIEMADGRLNIGVLKVILSDNKANIAEIRKAKEDDARDKKANKWALILVLIAAALQFLMTLAERWR